MHKQHGLRGVFVALAAVAALAWPALSQAQVYVRVGPPPPPHQVVVVRPGPAYVWTPGYQSWSGGRYVWVPGRWRMPPAGYRVWVAGRWVASPRGWYWVSGHWAR